MRIGETAVAAEEVAGIVRAVMAQNPAPAPESAVFPLTLECRVNAPRYALTQLAATINKSGHTLTVLGVTASLSHPTGSGGDYVDCRINGTTILTGAINLTTAGAVVAGTISGTPTIAPDDEIQLFVRTPWDDQDVCMVIWCEVQ